MTFSQNDLFCQQEIILKNFLCHVPFSGWTQESLKAAVMDAGYSAAETYCFFAGDIQEVIDFFFQWTTIKMEEAILALDLQNLSIRQRIQQAIFIRLQIWQPYKEALYQLLTHYGISLRNLPMNLRHFYQTIDTIWYAIGDQSVDFNYYTKRALLTLVYGTTLLKWLQDDSMDNQATHHFLDQRLDNVMLIPKIKKHFGKIIRQIF